MREYKVWFKLLAVILSVLIGFQVAPVFAVALAQAGLDEMVAELYSGEAA